MIQRLEEGLHQGHRLTLISAPAGFGKTTLLSEWAARRGRLDPLRLAWLSLDGGDDDPARFWTYFVTALRTVWTGIGEAMLAAFQARQTLTTESLLTGLINEISQKDAARSSCLLVLDDYHYIEAPAIHSAVSFLLENRPVQLHLVIATCVDPPLPLARLRGRGQLTELRQADLRFTPDEVAAFLNRMMDLGLSQEDVAALERRTEGWAVGLQMAVLALRALSSGDSPDKHSFVAAFAGDDRSGAKMESRERSTVPCGKRYG